MGLPVTLEGNNYKFNGTISDVRVKQMQISKMPVPIILLVSTGGAKGVFEQHFVQISKYIQTNI